MDVADVIVFVVDGKVGMALGDEEIANVLKRSGKPVIVCVNKLDKVGNENYNLYEFYNLGLGEPIAVSSVHGHGTGDLLDEVLNICQKAMPLMTKVIFRLRSSGSLTLENLRLLIAFLEAKEALFLTSRAQRGTRLTVQ